MRQWSELTFGKHAGKSLPQIVLSDPDWFFWAIDKGVLSKRGGQLAREAEEVERKACAVRIPRRESQRIVAEYVIHPGVNKFGGLNLVPEDQPRHEGASPTFRKPIIDLSVVRSIAEYDKMGGKLLLSAFKFHIFGNEGARMTRKRAEAFFDDDSNFDL